MRRVIAAAAVLALVVAAPASADPNSDAVNAVAGFNPANEATFETLDAVIDAQAANASVLRSALSTGDANRRWAAAYVAHNIARTEPDFRMLGARLRERDPSVRAMVAYGLLGGGKKQSIPVLIALLASRAEMRHSDPPHPLATLTNNRLKRLTGANFNFNHGASSRSRQRAIRAWQKWWREVRGNIRWDRTAHRYRWRRQRARSAVRTPKRAAPAARAAAYSSGSVANEKLTIEVNIELVFDTSVTFLQRQRIRNATENAEKVLDGRGRTGQCLDVDFKVNVKTRGPTDPPTPDYHKVEVDESNYIGHPGWRKSYVRTPKPGQEGRGRFYTQEVLDFGSSLTSHEILHLLSLGDEYKRNADGTVTHFDPENMLDHGVGGDLLQRHLDELVNRFAKEDERVCELYEVRFAPWRTQLFAHTISTATGKRHRIGELVTANVVTGFWLNPRTNKIKPEGEAKGGDSELTKWEAKAPPQASCSSVSLSPGRVQFHTIAGGERLGDALRITQTIKDEERFSYNCNPAASPASGTKALVSDGMKTAGATDFTIARPQVGSTSSKSFTITGDHLGGGGTAVLKRLK